MTYEMTRKRRMYLKNMRTVIIDVLDMLALLNGIDITSYKMRLFFTRFTRDSQTDLLANYPMKLVQSILTFAMVNNQSLAIRNIHSDANTYIYDIIHEGESKKLKDTLKLLLSKEAVSFVSKIEIITETNEGELFFLLKGYRDISYQESLFKSTDQIDILEPISFELAIDQEVIDKYHDFLKENYHIFYEDIKDKQCTIWCIRDGLGEYIVKRNHNEKKIVFPNQFEAAYPLLREEKVIQIVPNSIAETDVYPTELIIDIDTGNVDYEIVKIVIDRFTNWLVDNNFNFYKRLTGSWNGGSHLIIPIEWQEPYILTGSTTAWNSYKTKKARHVLCDSVRSMAVFLCVLFQQQNRALALYTTTRIFDPFSRARRILLDSSTNSLNRGRRALLSLHAGSFNLCVPFNRDLPDTKEELHEVVSLDMNISNGFVCTEEKRTLQMAKNNTKRLRQMINKYEPLYYSYLTTARMRFEEKHFNIAVNYLEL